jgi:hypothetical protein
MTGLIVVSGAPGAPSSTSPPAPRCTGAPDPMPSPRRVVRLTEFLAAELSPRRVRVNAIMPVVSPWHESRFDQGLVQDNGRS